MIAALSVLVYLTIGALVAYVAARWFCTEEFDCMMFGILWPLGGVALPIIAMILMFEYVVRCGARRR